MYLVPTTRRNRVIHLRKRIEKKNIVIATQPTDRSTAHSTMQSIVQILVGQCEQVTCGQINELSHSILVKGNAAKMKRMRRRYPSIDAMLIQQKMFAIERPAHCFPIDWIALSRKRGREGGGRWRQIPSEVLRDKKALYVHFIQGPTHLLHKITSVVRLHLHPREWWWLLFYYLSIRFDCIENDATRCTQLSFHSFYGPKVVVHAFTWFPFRYTMFALVALSLRERRAFSP